MAVRFELNGQEFVALKRRVGVTFDEAFSFQIDCADREEVDRYSEALTDGGEEGPCGWVKAPWRRCSRGGRSTSRQSRRPPTQRGSHSQRSDAHGLT